jgi:hypothetical protein
MGIAVLWIEGKVGRTIARRERSEKWREKCGGWGSYMLRKKGGKKSSTEKGEVERIVA